MVSFSCEGCGDVLTKKKLDSHRGMCGSASFTCLDCMTNFAGTDYRMHTSCISEAQKYEGKLYKEKAKRKSVTIALPEETHKQPYVEDVPDEPGSAIALVDAPPPVPSPPPSAPAHPVNVFDFLVDETTPTAPKSLAYGPSEQMSMVKDAPPVFKSLSSSPDEHHDHFADHYHTNGYSYGAAPIPAQALQTPAAQIIGRSRHNYTSSMDKKRKRHVEELDLSRTSRSSQELDDDDEEMLDAADNAYHANGAPVLHSGLTGGLNRLLSTTSNFPPSPDYSGADGNAEPSPLSPGKRKRSVASTAGGTEKSRGRRRHAAGSSQLIKVRKVRRSSDESRPRKHRRGHGSPGHAEHEHDHDGHDDGRRRRRSTATSLKAIEYMPAQQRSVSPNADNQVVVYQSRAELFLSMVGKGPESEHGYSVNKALKRYHRERATSGSSRIDKNDEEKELWKTLRLKRNERGEVVVFMGNGAPL